MTTSEASRKPLRRTKSLRSRGIAVPQPGEIADDRHPAVSAIEIVLPEVRALRRLFVLHQRGEARRLVRPFLDEPDFIAAEEVTVQQRRLVRRDDQLALAVTRIAQEVGDEGVGDFGVEAAVELVDDSQFIRA